MKDEYYSRRKNVFELGMIIWRAESDFFKYEKHTHTRVGAYERIIIDRLRVKQVKVYEEGNYCYFNFVKFKKKTQKIGFKETNLIQLRNNNKTWK